MAAPLSKIFAASKRLPATPSWVASENGRLIMTSPLDIDGVTVEGLLFRSWTLKNRPEEVVMLQLDYAQSDRRDYAIDRIDWRPLHNHGNGGRGPEEFRFKTLVGSHHHRFDLNLVEAEQRMLKSNLPVAVPFNDSADFAALLEFGCHALRILNLNDVPTPPWEKVLI